VRLLAAAEFRRSSLISRSAWWSESQIVLPFWRHLCVLSFVRRYVLIAIENRACSAGSTGRCLTLILAGSLPGSCRLSSASTAGSVGARSPRRVRADVLEDVVDAHGAERALIGADACIKRIGRQRLVAVLTGRSEFKHAVCRLMTRLAIQSGFWRYYVRKCSPQGRDYRTNTDWTDPSNSQPLALYLSTGHALLLFGINFNATPLLHQRFPVGGGPSSKTWPWWPPQRMQ
jgi:hypothetical protein